MVKNRCRWNGHSAWLVFLSVILAWLCHCPADQADLLSIVRAAHRSARQSIHSFSATVTDKVTRANQPPYVLTGKYWRSFDVVRDQENVGSGTEDFLLKDSEIRQVGRGVNLPSGRPHYGASRKVMTEGLGLSDVWRLMMIDFGGPDGGCYDFDRFLEFAQHTPQVKRERKDGLDCVRVGLSVVSTRGLKQNVTLWHDIARNHLVWKMTLTYENEAAQFEAEILDFTEPSPGVFVPIKCRRQSFREGERNSLQEISLSDVQVNQPIPKSVFQLPTVPAGTILYDWIQHTKYPIDANWKSIGPTSPLERHGFAAPSESKSGYYSQSTTEPRSFRWWLIYGSLILLVIACAGLVYRRYRSLGYLRRAE